LSHPHSPFVFATLLSGVGGVKSPFLVSVRAYIRKTVLELIPLLS
jgi:hypothetical protein